MSVYVDDMGAPYRGMIMFHMIADTSKELLAMADKIGVAKKWIQHPCTYREHFDICASKRKLAVKEGAIQIRWRDYAQMVGARQTAIAAQRIESIRSEGGDFELAKR